jgi:3-isopropylmalate/(R)-2-methylmalate dehydratase large subunit
MGMTVTEKILAAHAGLETVTPGQIISCRVDLVMANDVTGPPARRQLKAMGATRVFDPERVVLVPSHFAPPKDTGTAQLVDELRRMGQEYGVRFLEIGEMGIEHAVLPDQGFVAPGELIIGGDSHSTTYGALGAFSTGMAGTDIAAALALGETWLRVPETMRFEVVGRLNTWVTAKDVILTIIGRIGVHGARSRAMEYSGSGLDQLSMDDRLAITNMTVEAGGKNGIMPVDRITEEYLAGRVTRPWTAYTSDGGATFVSEDRVDLNGLEPIVAEPYSPANVRPAADVKGVRITQVFIGSCTNARLTDLRQAAELLRGRKIAHGVRLIVTPASQQIYLDALREGLIETFIQAGAAVTTPGCGACAGLHSGVLGPDDVCVSTTNRNFRGRMGHRDARTYLASAYVAAASAIVGEVASPRDIVAAPAILA